MGSVVFDDEIAHLAKDFGDEAKALKLVEQDHGLVTGRCDIFCVFSAFWIGLR